MRPPMPQPRNSTLRTLGSGSSGIDPIDDLVHLLSGIVGALICWRGTQYLPAYFIVIGIVRPGEPRAVARG